MRLGHFFSLVIWWLVVVMMEGVGYEEKMIKCCSS